MDENAERTPQLQPNEKRKEVLSRPKSFVQVMHRKSDAGIYKGAIYVHSVVKVDAEMTMDNTTM